MAKLLDPAKTFNLDDFIKMKYSDQQTYYQFSMLEKYDNIEFLSWNIIDDYIEQLPVRKIELSDQEFKKYKYHPDLLAYDVYGSVQLDFVILNINDMIDPKEFDRKLIKLPFSSDLSTFLDLVYSSNYHLLQKNRLEQNISTL